MEESALSPSFPRRESMIEAIDELKKVYLEAFMKLTTNALAYLCVITVKVKSKTFSFPSYCVWGELQIHSSLCMQ